MNSLIINANMVHLLVGAGKYVNQKEIHSNVTGLEATVGRDLSERHIYTVRTRYVPPVAGTGQARAIKSRISIE